MLQLTCSTNWSYDITHSFGGSLTPISAAKKSSSSLMGMLAGGAVVVVIGIIVVTPYPG
jgi:hypothetical protein